MADDRSIKAQQSIANQIFKVVFAFYFLVTMMVTTILVLTDYRTAEKQIREEIGFVVRRRTIRNRRFFAEVRQRTTAFCLG